MQKKEEFTKIIKDSSALAKARPVSLSCGEVVDGAGAIIKNSKGELAYDLRSIKTKGILPPNHPVRIASKLNPKQVPENIAFFDEFKMQTGARHAIITKLEPESFNNLDFSLLYSDPKRLFPVAKCDSELALPLENGYAIIASKDATHLNKYSAAAWHGFFPAYLEFAHHILINKGFGRIRDIENALRSCFQKSGVQDLSVSGCNIKIPIRDLDSQAATQSFYKEGILVDCSNFSESAILLNIPVSIFDYQIKEVAEKTKKSIKKAIGSLHANS